MELLNNIIPTSSPVFKQLKEIAESSQVVIFSGLPGVGKSLYIREFQLIAKSLDIPVDIIQWDVARKAFETAFIAEHFPMGKGTVHNGLKLIAGKWLIDEVDLWIEQYLKTKRILLVEAPLVGHRFIELVTRNSDSDLEAVLSSSATKVVMPIPSKQVREKIEEDRARQVDESAKVWLGAKPSVMLMLWKMTCEIANEFGKQIDLSGQPPYDPDIYEFVFGHILKHRNFVSLKIDEVFSVPEESEAALHSTDSIVADSETADHYGQIVIDNYTEKQLDNITANWYKT